MNILMLSSDKTVLNGTRIGDTINRLELYGKNLTWLDVVVYANKKENFDTVKISSNVTGIPSNSWSKLFFCFDVIKIFHRLNLKHKIDLIIAQDPFIFALAGWWLKKKYKIKLLIHFHGDFWQNPQWLQEKWYNIFLLFLSYYTVKKADAIRVVSAGIKQKLIRRGIGAQKITVISTPVNLRLFLMADTKQNQLIKQKFGLVSEDKIILFVGRLEPEKNLLWFLDVFNEVIKHEQYAKFLIIGTGGERNKIIKKIKFLNLTNKIILIGGISHAELPIYYHLANVLVLPSTSESFGKVLVEAGAAAIPCVASATTGAKEIIKDNKTGFLVPINNLEEMKNKILTVLADKELQKKMGQTAQNFVKENFSREILIKKIIYLWSKTINQL
ncbi:MAG TPA: glycosyltransferase family 4 protein [bacterium]|nr:glycosyltransferase family 4 protein [bacterium]